MLTPTTLLITFEILLLCLCKTEFNMGERIRACSVCQAEFPTLSQHAHHQKIHSSSLNFSFVCGAPSCPCPTQSFQTFANLNSHISKWHKGRRQESTSESSFKCPHCSSNVSTVEKLCQHLKTHAGEREISLLCPLKGCCRNKPGDKPFENGNAFSKHLSQHHSGWQKFASLDCLPDVLFERVCDTDDVQMETLETMSEDVEGTDSIFYDCESSFDYLEEDVFNYVGKFYLMLETECFLPVTVIDKISEKITYMSEMVICNMKSQITSVLKSDGISVPQIEKVLCTLADSNALYLSHHKNLRGPSFTSEYLRRKFYKNYFKFLPPEEINLSMDPLDPEILEYVSPRRIITHLLQDPSIQKEIVKSFERHAAPNKGKANNKIYTDYTDGTVFKERNLPTKRIDLIFFQDGFRATSMMTTVANKHKCLGSYMTIGNLQPHLRTKLKAMHLVIMVLENHVKKYRQKCFERLKEDLLDLEENGIEFMGEVLPVILQFFVGDNLGSHFLGGFMEGFTAKYPCRYCPINKKQFLNDPTRMEPDRIQSDYEKSAAIVEERSWKSHLGVKENSVLNELKYFKVCDPGFPPCLGHDLFHGCFDKDLASMIKHFVDEEWFSYKRLNRRISIYKYAAADSKNKPAPVKTNGSKLGGSAVQNWCLIRLLPFIIEGLVKDPNDNFWKLYLLLRQICELVCAPAISEKQINHLDVLMQLYLGSRSILSNNFTPKHHFARHYPNLIRQVGPLIHLWGMRFEQKHQFFKKIARICNNFINLPYTLAFRHQLLFAFESESVRFPSNMSFDAYEIRPGYFNEQVSSLLQQEGLDKLRAASKITQDGLQYMEGGWLALQQLSNTRVKLGLIEAIMISTGEAILILKSYEAVRQRSSGLYRIDMETPGGLMRKDISQLDYSSLLTVYDYKDKLCFSLKHTLPLL